MILALKTDQPEAELWLISNGKMIDHYSWVAHRELSSSLMLKIEQLLKSNQTSKEYLSGIIVYTGPGSFTGLRIGVATANSIAYGLNIPVSGISSHDWSIDKLQSYKFQNSTFSEVTIPDYGAEAHITKPKK
jgi:tRNA threonylcarbamoyladenosine biosynthesis protein TsaB